MTALPFLRHREKMKCDEIHYGRQMTADLAQRSISVSPRPASRLARVPWSATIRRRFGSDGRGLVNFGTDRDH